MALGGSYSHDIENFDVVKSFLDMEAMVLMRLVKIRVSLFCHRGWKMVKPITRHWYQHVLLTDAQRNRFGTFRLLKSW